MSTDGLAPSGLLDAFWRYERALAADDLATLDELFAEGPQTLRGDRGGLLVGHDSIAAFRRYRKGAPEREIDDVHLRPIDDRNVLVVAVTAPHRGGHGLQTQLWHRDERGWKIVAAHVSDAPRTFDAATWRLAGDPLVPPAGAGALTGESVAVKDLFAVAGFGVGAGVPQYLAGQAPRREHAAALRLLLDAGASVRGIARTDQFAYSVDGDNPHYGPPLNASVPGGLPGGSSSGCGTAVALGEATIGLGTDTAGSIRVPASYQGLWGLRMTHGAVPVDGLLPLAPDFDAVGLLTRTPELLLRAAAVLTGNPDAGQAVGTVTNWEQVLPLMPSLDDCYKAFRVHQAYQAWQVHGEWIRAHPDALVGSARQRFAAAATVTADDDAKASSSLREFRERLDDLLADRVLIMPSAPGPAPHLWTGPDEREARRRATLQLTCLAGITGRPAVSSPSVRTTGGPVGTSYVGPRGTDVALARLAMDRAHQPTKTKSPRRCPRMRRRR